MNWIVTPQDDSNNDQPTNDACAWSLFWGGIAVCIGSDVLCVCSQFQLFGSGEE